MSRATDIMKFSLGVIDEEELGKSGLKEMIRIMDNPDTVFAIEKDIDIEDGKPWVLMTVDGYWIDRKPTGKEIKKTAKMLGVKV